MNSYDRAASASKDEESQNKYVIQRRANGLSKIKYTTSGKVHRKRSSFTLHYTGTFFFFDHINSHQISCFHKYASNSALI